MKVEGTFHITILRSFSIFSPPSVEEQVVGVCNTILSTIQNKKISNSTESHVELYRKLYRAFPAKTQSDD